MPPYVTTRGLQATSPSPAGAPVVGWAVAEGTGAVITATYTPSIPTLFDGLLVGLRASAAGPSVNLTFAPDEHPAYPIKRDGGDDLLGGDVPAENAELLLRFRVVSTGNHWELLNPATDAVTLYEAGELEQGFLDGIALLAVPDPDPSILFLQSLATVNCAAVEHFSIPDGMDPDRHFLVVCPLYDPNTTGYNLAFQIYERDGDGLFTILKQTIPSSGANCATFFTRNGKYYLALANYNNNSTYNLSSTIVPWDGTLDGGDGLFDLSSQQSITTRGCQKIYHTHRSDDDKHYLCFASSVTDGNLYRVNSEIWMANDGDDDPFTLHQAVQTNGCYALRAFEAPAHSSTAFFLATAEFYNDNGGTPPWIGHTFPSRVMAWTGTNWTTAEPNFQTVTFDGASDVVHVITPDNNEWIAWSASQSDTSFQVAGRIYKYSVGDANFIPHQIIQMKNGQRVRHASLGGDDYLIFVNTNSGDLATSNFFDSRVEFWRYDSGTVTWVLAFTLPGIGAYDCVAWEDAELGFAYAFVANSYDGTSVHQDSKLYRLAITV